MGDGGLDGSVTDKLQKMFQTTPGVVGAAARDGRGDSDYWADHGEVTGKLMALMTKRWGGNAELYERVGRIHDVDYLAYPHDAAGPGDRHPVPLVRALDSAGVHPAVSLAVLEHAAYTGLDRAPSSRLSACLSAAEELVTLAALRPRFEDVLQLSEFNVGCVIQRNRRVHVEGDPERFVNTPLRLVEQRVLFLFDV
jgi:hypothetical protein